MNLIQRTLAVSLVAAILPVTSYAADETDPTRITADLGFIKTGGNSDVTTLSASEKLERKAGRWVLIQDAIAVWGETGGVESAGRYGLRLRADRMLSDRLSAYALTGWNRNTFAGISRQFDEGVGLAWKAVAAAPHAVDVEAGVGLAQRRPTIGPEDDFATARTGLAYAYAFTEKSRFTARGAYVFNLEDTDDGQGEAQLALVAPMAGSVALKASYDLLYRKRPLPGLEKVDTTFGVGVQATF